MKSKTMILISTLLLLVSSTTVAYSSPQIIENTGIRIVSNGKSFATNGIPILMNGRALLPLTDIMPALGIQNDRQHIIWNSSEKSICLIKNTSKTHSFSHQIWDIDKRILSLSFNSNCIYGSGGSTSFNNWIYTADGKTYIRSNDESWKLDPLIGTEKSDLFINDFGKLFYKSVYYSGLNKEENPESDEIILEGDVINISEIDKGDRVINCHTKIVIDKSNFLIKQVTAFSNTIHQFNGEDYLKHYTDYDYHYKKLDGDYQISNPVANNKLYLVELEQNK